MSWIKKCPLRVFLLRLPLAVSLITLMMLSLLSTAFGLMSRGETAGAASQAKKVKSISVVKPEISRLSLKKGSKYRLKTEILPKTAKNKKVTYRSSKPSVVSVSSRGILSAKKAGTAKVTVRATDGSKKMAGIQVKVVKKLKKVSKVTLNTGKVTLYVNGTGGSDKKAGSDGKAGQCKLWAKILPKNATEKKAVFQSSDRSVASVDQSGTVKAKKAGTAKITAYAADGWGKKATCTVTVEQGASSDQASQKPAVPSASPVPTPPAAPSATPKEDGVYVLAEQNRAAQILLDANGADFEGLKLIADCVADDVKLVADADMDVITKAEELKGTLVIAGSIGNHALIDSLIREGKLDVSAIRGKWETYKIEVVENPVEGIPQALVVVGSDKRGTIYGMFHISEQMGVSPWVYWADVNPAKQQTVSFRYSQIETVSKEPSVKYRGIFLNDEEPSLGTWVNNFFKGEKGGKFNENFYEKVFQLILRLKGNYLWPAMWNSSFGADGYESADASAKLADTYGVVMGTSHHEPMMLAHQDWVRNKKNYGTGEWDFVKNREGLMKFFEEGAKTRGAFDNIATVGMRGDGDTTMLPEGSTLEENISLLKEIITEQKNILNQHGLQEKPKMLALYKEVEEYWQGGDGVPGLREWEGLDDVTILLSEDNYGNVRTLPTDANKNRESGWGMYYHFDYNGAPASYQWVLSKSRATVQVGKTLTLSVKNAAKKAKITWSSKQKKIAKVVQSSNKKAKIRGVKAGKTTITAKYKLGKKKKTLSCKVTVQDKSNARKTVTPTGAPSSSPLASSVPPAQSFKWVTTWGTAEEKCDVTKDAMPKQALPDTTVREIIRVTTGGDKLRLRLSNQYGDSDVEIKSMHLAKQVKADESTIDTATDQAVTVGGSEEFVIPAGQVIVTDEVAFPVNALDNVAVSIYFGPMPEKTVLPGIFWNMTGLPTASSCSASMT